MYVVLSLLTRLGSSLSHGVLVQMRVPYMVQCLSKLEPGSTCVIFTPTCKLCEELAVTLRELEYRVVSLHSQVGQYSVGSKQG
jgi:superfamily II DNA/RNA helicase